MRLGAFTIVGIGICALLAPPALAQAQPTALTGQVSSAKEPT
jgi:hypothetical protein